MNNADIEFLRTYEREKFESENRTKHGGRYKVQKMPLYMHVVAIKKANCDDYVGKAGIPYLIDEFGRIYLVMYDCSEKRVFGLGSFSDDSLEIVRALNGDEFIESKEEWMPAIRKWIEHNEIVNMTSHKTRSYEKFISGEQTSGFFYVPKGTMNRIKADNDYMIDMNSLK